MRYRDIVEGKKLSLPDIEVGDEVRVGKFKNRRAVVKGFTTDDNNQPVLKTDKGDQKLFKPRIVKLMNERADPNSPQFRAWFGGSKVVDEHGRPLLCYHGTQSDHAEFLPLSHFGSLDVANYFAGNERLFPISGSNVRPVYLRIINPLELPDGELSSDEQIGFWLDEMVERGNISSDEAESVRAARWSGGGDDFWKITERFIEVMRMHGYDGITYLNTMEDEGSRSWVIFSPDQVWPATLVQPDAVQEAWDKTVRLGCGADVDVFADPSVLEFRKLMRKFPSLRAMFDDQNRLLVFDANMACHADIERHYQFEGGAWLVLEKDGIVVRHLEMYRDGPGRKFDPALGRVLEKVMSNPTLRRLYPSMTIYGSDDNAGEDYLITPEWIAKNIKRAAGRKG